MSETKTNTNQLVIAKQENDKHETFPREIVDVECRLTNEQVDKIKNHDHGYFFPFTDLFYDKESFFKKEKTIFDFYTNQSEKQNSDNIDENAFFIHELSIRKCLAITQIPLYFHVSFAKRIPHDMHNPSDPVTKPTENGVIKKINHRFHHDNSPSQLVFSNGTFFQETITIDKNDNEKEYTIAWENMNTSVPLDPKNMKPFEKAEHKHYPHLPKLNTPSYMPNISSWVRGKEGNAVKVKVPSGNYVSEGVYQTKDFVEDTHKRMMNWDKIHAVTLTNSGIWFAMSEKSKAMIKKWGNGDISFTLRFDKTGYFINREDIDMNQVAINNLFKQLSTLYIVEDEIEEK